jgi:phospholipid transport system substrate-binding protein
MEEVRQTLDLVVATNERLVGEARTKERRDALRKIIEPRFNFNEMAKRSLGPEWSKRSKEEQTEFADTFAKLLASTYLDRVETATREMIRVDKEKVQFPRAIVRTTVESRGETFPIDYKLQYSDGAWRVYDVVIENIGLVANYRSEFAGIIRKEDFSGLMKKLREKAA